MKNSINDLCSLCREAQALDENLAHLQNVIYKYLHIKLNDLTILNLCDTCKETIENWDRFAQKCWHVHNLLNHKDGIKLEDNSYVEIKVENSIDVSENNEEDEDDNKDLSTLYGIKQEDPLLAIKLEKKKKISKLSQRKKSNRLKSSKKLSDGARKFKQEQENSFDDTDFINHDDEEERTEKSSKQKVSVIEYNCHICSTETNGWFPLTRHFSKEHPSVKVKVLCICGKYLGSRRSIIRHNDLHDETKGFKCTECNKKFVQQDNLKEHMLTHFPNKDYKYCCPHCSRKFVLVQIFNKHVKTHLPPELKYTFSCDICGDKFTTKSNVKAHKTIKHEKLKHVCDLCGRSFTTKGNLETHRGTVHSDMKNFQCDKCSKKFKTKDLLKRHLNVHGSTKLKCPLCPVLLKSKSTYRSHMDVHNNVYRYTCKICSKKFRKSNNLKVHMNTHGDMKPL